MRLDDLVNIVAWMAVGIILVIAAAIMVGMTQAYTP